MRTDARWLSGVVYTVPDDFRFTVDGKKVSGRSLRQG